MVSTPVLSSKPSFIASLSTTCHGYLAFSIKYIEFSCPILPLNNLPKVCYDTSQENKVL